MNGKKAKALRSAAGYIPSMPSKYAVKEGTTRTLGVGKPACNEKGLPVYQSYFQTQTLVLEGCARQVYKVLKRLANGKAYT